MIRFVVDDEDDRYPMSMSQTVFGLSARMRSQGVVPRYWRAVGAIASALLGCAALGWWNGLLDPHEPLKQVVLLLGSVALSGFGVWGAWRSEERSLPLVLWALVAAIGVTTGVSSAVAPDAASAWFGVGGSIVTSASLTVAALLVFCIASQLRIVKWEGYPRLVIGVYLAMVLLGVLQMSGWVDLSPGVGAAKVFSPLGSALVLGWVSVLISIWLAWKHEAHTWYEALTLATALGWLMVLDRTELWAVVIGIVCLGALLSKMWRIDRARRQWLVTGSVLVIALVGLVVPVPRPRGLPQIVSLSWSQSVAVIRDVWSRGDWAFGSGQAQWSPIYERIRPVEMNLGERFGLRFEHGTSWLLTSAAQEGAIGVGLRGIFFLLIILHVGVLAHRHSERLSLTLVALAGIVLLSVGMPHSWMLLTIFGLLGYMSGDAYDWPRGGKLTWMSMLIVFGAALLVGSIWVTPRLVAERSSRLLQRASSNERLIHARRAMEYAPWVAEYAFVAVEERTRLLEGSLKLPMGERAALQRDLSELLELTKQTTDRWPYRSESWLARARAYALIAGVTQGADQFAIQAYQEGIRISPQNPVFPLGIGQVYARRAEEAFPGGAPTSSAAALAAYRLEQRRLAAQWLQRALELKPDDEGMAYFYAVNLAKSGELSAAVPIFRALVESRAERADLRLEYAALLASLNQRTEAIRLAETIPSNHALYSASRRLLADWYAAERLWAQALAAWKQLPASEQTTSAFRTRLRELQSKAGSSSGR